ncbi:unnamed protein product [Orchesella dallaii]|uniref:Uncharacterized protein n=1 Tax=Orchesella dallaii TaxID=48710 RepID=A0ABP1RDG8_9HEXA
MQTKVIVLGAVLAILATIIVPSEGYVPAVSVILPLEYALFKLKAAAIAGLLYLTGGHAGLNFDIGAGPGYGWGRKRRDVSAVEEVKEAIVEVKDTSVDDIMAYDQLGCGMRLVCELAAAPSVELQDDEKLLLQLFGQGSAKDKSSKAGKFSYVYAENLGSKGDVQACTKTYPACPYASNQIMAAIRGAKEVV